MHSSSLFLRRRNPQPERSAQHDDARDKGHYADTIDLRRYRLTSRKMEIEQEHNVWLEERSLLHQEHRGRSCHTPTSNLRARALERLRKAKEILHEKV